MRQNLDQPLRFLTVMVTVVLLITIVNVANLLIARSAARRKEMAVRLSIGAGGAALIRQVLVESIVLALIGGLLGLVLAYVGTPVFLRLFTQNLNETSLNEYSRRCCSVLDGWCRGVGRLGLWIGAGAVRGSNANDRCV